MQTKTTDYEIFKFRKDNRERIDQAHVQRLVSSIKSRNLLELRPIIVNQDMEIIDGQHRLLAAKQLGVEIYYKKENNLSSNDIILMNIAKSWACADYLNYYVTNGFPEYIKLQKFMKENKISLRVALNICMGTQHAGYRDYKIGKFAFKEEALKEEISIIWETIEVIKKNNGFSPYVSSSRFWRAMLKLVNHHNFDEHKWKANLPKMVERFSAKAKTEDYCRLIMEIYNWRNQERIQLIDEDF